MSNKYLNQTGVTYIFNKLKTLLNTKADSDHTHNYAGSASVGGVANSANKLENARNINGVAFDGTEDITVEADIDSLTNDELNAILDGVTVDDGKVSIYLEQVQECVQEEVALAKGEVKTEVTDAVMAEVEANHNAVMAEVEANQSHTILKRNTSYQVGDVVYSPDLPSWAYLECVTAGTTDDIAPNLS